MVGVFASLKWRLVTSRLRATHGGARVGIIMLFVVLLGLLGLLTVGIASLRAVPEYAEPVIVTLFTVQLVGWVLTPLVAFGVDETVDPARFALLPLRPQTLQRGLLASSMIGYFPVANMIVLVGAAIALGVPWSVLPVALVCAAVQLMLCVVLSRAASTSMSALMASRRGRDLGMVVGLLIFLLYMAFVTVINHPGDGTALQSGALTVASVLQWTPPGALAALPHLVATGQWAPAAAAAVRAGRPRVGLVVVVGGTAQQPDHRAVHDSGLFPAGHGPVDTAVGVGIGGTMRVVAGRDRVLVWRDPMRRMPWLMMTVLTIIWPFLVVRGKGAVFAVALGAIFCGAQAGNQYGVEGSGLWLHLQTITDRVRARGEVLGHAVTALVPGIVIVLVAIAVQAIYRDDLQNVPAAVGVASLPCWAPWQPRYLSAAVPYAQPQSRKSLFASSVPGQKGRTAPPVSA